MKTFEFRLKNGKIREFSLPDAARTYRAIVWIPKSSNGKKTQDANFFILSDDIEQVDEIID